MKSVKIRDLVDILDCRADEAQYYLNKKTAEVIMVQDEYMRVALGEDEDEDIDLSRYQDWERECIREAIYVLENEDDFETLPEAYEVHEYKIMSDFCSAVEDDRLSDKLCDLIRGRGAFRCFKDAIYRYGVANQWYEFKEKALRKIAREWCVENGIPYVDV